MSTILKSLKKLEQEKEANRFPVQAAGYTGPGAVAAAGGQSPRTKSTWIKWGIVTLLIMGLGASSLYFYRQSKSQTSALPDTAQALRPPGKETVGGAIERPSRDNLPQANPRPMAKVQNQPSPKVRKPVRRSIVDPAPVQNSSDPKGDSELSAGLPPQGQSSTVQSFQSRKPASTPDRQVSQPLKMPQRRQSVDKGRKQTPITAVPTDPPVSTARVRETDRPAPKKEIRPSDAYNDLSPLTDGRLKIQAIVWSDLHEDRMAVINTQIVYEGDSVAGFAVVAIRPDDVVVRGEGGVMYRVIFGRP